MSRGLTTRLRKLEAKAGLHSDVSRMSDEALHAALRAHIRAMGGTEATAAAMHELGRPDLARIVEEIGSTTADEFMDRSVEGQPVL